MEDDKMKITDAAMKKFATFIKPDSGLAEGIRIFQGNGCCGPAISMSIVKQPHSTDIHENHSGFNIYLDQHFGELRDTIIIDYVNEYFQIQGITNTSKSGCC